MSCCDGNAPAAATAKCGSGPCGDDKKTAETPVPAVAPEKPQCGGAGGCENGCKCGANCNCNPCTCNNSK